MLEPGSPLTVRLIKDPRPEVSYPAVVCYDDGEHLVVEAVWAGPSRDLGFVRFQAGDVFIEHYWRDRWYSIKEVHGPDGLKGWYCDVTRPASVQGTQVVVADLELDLWISADRRLIVRLDEDEFAASVIPQREPEVARRARAALDELERIAREELSTLLRAGPPASGDTDRHRRPG